MFVLDTNVLMHDPTSLYRFDEHDIFVPMVTLEEATKERVRAAMRHAGLRTRRMVSSSAVCAACSWRRAGCLPSP